MNNYQEKPAKAKGIGIVILGIIILVIGFWAYTYQIATYIGFGMYLYEFPLRTEGLIMVVLGIIIAVVGAVTRAFTSKSSYQNNNGMSEKLVDENEVKIENSIFEQKKTESLNFTRQDLRASMNFFEGDYKAINPRRFYRSLKRSLEEIKGSNGFKYTTDGDQETDLKILKESVGEKTGQVQGRIQATATPEPLGSIRIDYSPNSPIILVVGSSLAILSLFFLDIGILLTGLIIAGFGYFKYIEKSQFLFPVQSKDGIRILMTGEVSERTINQNGESVTDIFADMSVIYSINSAFSIPINDFKSLDKQKRATIVRMLVKWYNQNSVEIISIHDGFFDDLRLVFDADDGYQDMKTVEEVQQRIQNNNRLTSGFNQFISSKLVEGYKEVNDNETLMNELKDLSDNMRVFVSREGIKV